MAGHSASHVVASIGGSQIESQNSRGVVAISTPQGEISDTDLVRVIDAAKAISMPSTRDIIHVLPRNYVVDGQEGIKDPIGMSGVRLEVDTHIISANSISVRNLDKAFSQVGIDLAISKNDSADNTAMVSGLVYGHSEDMRIYILPNPVNERLTFLETIDRSKDLADAIARGGRRTVLHVEDVGYQHALIEELERDGLHVIGVPPKGQDKRARLALVTHLIQSGRVLFPVTGCDALVNQLVGFGSERYDDLADALAILLLPILELQGHRSNLDILELNRRLHNPTFEEERAEARKHDRFFYPDHSDDRDSGGYSALRGLGPLSHDNILNMQFIVSYF
jgi:predicted phage terminase large subunit-like protein